MRESRIRVMPLEMLSILEYKSSHKVNEHSEMYLSGLIDSDKKKEYMQRAVKETWIRVLVYDEDEKEKTLFCGVLTNFRIRSEGNSCIMELKLESGTKLMDYQKHIRSFQRGGYTYNEIINICNSQYEKADTIMAVGNNVTIPGFMMQYEETDWQFLKRLASALNVVLISDVSSEGEHYFVGIKDQGVLKEIDVENYSICYEYQQSAKDKEKIISYYIVNSREIFSLGSQTIFQGNKVWVWKVIIEWKGDQLYHTYYLKSRKDFEIQREFNQEIIGLSLMGVVTDVRSEQVQIKLDKDENPNSGSRWFDFSTVYSSPDGAGWYCMPEPGDSVRMLIPSEDESEAYVISAVHKNDGAGIRSNPDHKIWRNKQGKEIRMTPDKIQLTNNAGMSVELTDGKGVTIKSNATINIKASDEINISSNANLEMVAGNKIVLKQGNTTMELAESIKLSGANINLQ